MIYIGVILRDDTDIDAACKAIGTLPGVNVLERVFPDDPDDELRRLLMVTPAEGQAGEVVCAIKVIPGVESAYEAPLRK